jgi:peptide-methionine (S)-S-oxide reductase
MRDKKLKSGCPRDMEVATLGGGCFWCIEAAFEFIQGVVSVKSGYAGGDITSPTYDQVCTGTTKHVEVVQITFNPAIITFKEILEVFFTVHDPTTLDRQGADIGSQYRSVIFYHDEKQKVTAKRIIQELEATKVWDNPIVTKIEPFKNFYRAEEYHRKYYVRNPEAQYCKFVIDPKINKLRKKYHEKLKRKT